MGNELPDFPAILGLLLKYGWPVALALMYWDGRLRDAKKDTIIEKKDQQLLDVTERAITAISNLTTVLGARPRK